MIRALLLLGVCVIPPIQKHECLIKRGERYKLEWCMTNGGIFLEHCRVWDGANRCTEF